MECFKICNMAEQLDKCSMHLSAKIDRNGWQQLPPGYGGYNNNRGYVKSQDEYELDNTVIVPYWTGRECISPNESNLQGQSEYMTTDLMHLGERGAAPIAGQVWKGRRAVAVC